MQNLHAHSVFCDGKNMPEEMIRACLAAGMDSAGISIHSPLPFENGWAAKAENVAPFLAEMQRLKAAYAGRIAVYAGVEWDVLSDAEWLEPFDYAIGSAHFLPVGGDPAAYPTVDGSPKTTRRFLAELSAATATRRRNAILPSLNASPTNRARRLSGISTC
ncbi:MAG: PHP domain-containing protein [Christensenellales bacterium]